MKMIAIETATAASSVALADGEDLVASAHRAIGVGISVFSCPPSNSASRRLGGSRAMWKS